MNFQFELNNTLFNLLIFFFLKKICTADHRGGT